MKDKNFTNLKSHLIPPSFNSTLVRSKVGFSFIKIRRIIFRLKMYKDIVGGGAGSSMLPEQRKMFQKPIHGRSNSKNGRLLSLEAIDTWEDTFSLSDTRYKSFCILILMRIRPSWAWSF